MLKKLEIPEFCSLIGLEFRSYYSDNTEITEQTKLAAFVLYRAPFTSKKSYVIEICVPVSNFPREKHE